MLTDYHLHLRPDEEDASAERYFTAENVDRYLAAAAAVGIEELGVSEHVYRFRQALDLWRHPLWVANARDDIDAYCAFVRSTPLKLGIECDFVPGAEDAHRRAAGRAGLRLRRRLRPLHRRGRLRRRSRRLGRLGGERRSRRDLAPLLRGAGRVRPLGPLRHPRPSRPGQGLGRRPARCPSATSAPTTSPRSRRSPRVGSRSSSPPPACASRSASSTRPVASPRSASRRGRRSRSPPTPTCRSRSASRTTARSSSSTRSASARSASSSAASAASSPLASRVG